MEDNDAVRDMLKAVMRVHGFAVWAAPGGHEGVVCFREHRTEIDVVLLDVCMPEGDGPEAMAAIRAIDPVVPCCFMSGFAGRYTLEDLLGLGAVTVLRKPFRVAELVDQVQQLTGPSAHAHARQRRPEPEET